MTGSTAGAITNWHWVTGLVLTSCLLDLVQRISCDDLQACGAPLSLDCTKFRDTELVARVVAGVTLVVLTKYTGPLTTTSRPIGFNWTETWPTDSALFLLAASRPAVVSDLEWTLVTQLYWGN